MTITDAGLQIDTLRDILGRVETRQKADIDPNLDTDADSPVGQNNGIFSREVALAWEALEESYDMIDPDKATGDRLISLCKLTGTIPRGDTYTTVVCSCDLDAGTTLESGTHFAEVDTDPESRWTPVEDYTATSSGVQDVEFRANVVGPETLANNSLTIISTSVTGWNSVTNGTNAESVGFFADDTDQLRARRAADVARTGSATVSAIAADVRAADTENILSVTVFSNRTDWEVDGIPPKAMEVLVYDGIGQDADNDVIAQAIYDSYGPGTRTIGAYSGTATDSDTGETEVIRFSRPEVVTVYITIDITGTADETELADYIATQAQALATPGVSLQWRRVDSLAYQFLGVESVDDFKMGTTPSPVSASNIAITSRQIASIDPANVNVTVTP